MKKVLKSTIAMFMIMVMVFGAAPLSGFVGLKFPELKFLSSLSGAVSDFFDKFTIKAKATTYSGTCGENLIWLFDTNSGELSISGAGDMTDYSESVYSPWFPYGSDIKSVTIGKDVTSISVCSLVHENIIEIIVDYDNAYYSNDDYGVLFSKDKTRLIKYPAGNSRTNYTIPDSVTRIGDSAFYNCNLISVIIPDSVTSIGCSAFQWCDNLKNVILPDGLTSISDRTFEMCSSLTSVTIGDNVRNIGDQAFSFCTKLTSITIPDSVTSIGAFAFSSCYNITSVSIGESVEIIGDFAFSGCEKLADVIIPDSVLSIHDNAFPNYTAFTVGKNNKNYSSDLFGALFDKEKTKLIRYPASNTVSNYTIPNSVLSIGDRAFCGCKLMNVIIPDSVISIGKEAFYDCDITSAIIPDSVTNIGDGAFNWCFNLTRVLIGNGITSIPKEAFFLCDKLVSVSIGKNVTSIENAAFYDCYSLTNIIIPDSVTSIGGRAFYYCKSLTNITIGNGLTSIGFSAFEQCPIKDVYYEGSEEKWNSIVIEPWNDVLLFDATIHFNTNGSDGLGMNVDIIGTGSSKNDIIITPKGRKLASYSEEIFDTSGEDHWTVSGVSLSIGSTTMENTSSNKNFVVSTGATGNEIKLTKADYRTYIIPGLVSKSWITETEGLEIPVKSSKPQYHHTAYMQKDTKDGKPYVSTVFGKETNDISYKELQSSKLILTKDGRYDIIISVVNNTNSSCTYYIEQDAEHKLESSTGIFLGADLFAKLEAGKKTYAYVKTSDGVVSNFAEILIERPKTEETFEEKFDTLFSYDSFKLLGPDFLSLNISDNIPLIGGAEVSFSAFSLPAGFEMDGNNLKVSIGANIFNYGTSTKENSETEYKKWSKECFSDWKDVVKGTTLTEAFTDTLDKNYEQLDKYKKAQENFKKKWAKGDYINGKSSKSKNWDIDALGYIELSFINNEWILKEALISVEGSFTFSHTIQGSIWILPAYCYVEAGASLGATGTISRFIENKSIPFEFDFSIKLEPNVKLGAGAGVKGFASLGVYAKATLPINIDISNEHLTIILKGEIGAEAQLLFIKATKKLIDGSVDVLNHYWGDSARLVTQSNPITGEEETYLITYEIDDRNYLEETSDWLGNDELYTQSVGTLSEGGMQLTDLQTSVFANAQPRMITFGDKMLLTWLEDDSTRDEYNRMRLVYSVYDGSVWSEPQPVYDDGCNDNYPVLATDGTNVYFTWQKVGKVLTEDDCNGIDSIVGSMETCIATYDATTDSIINTRRITENEVYDYSQHVSIINGEPVVYWVTCNDNQMDSSSNNTLYRSDFNGNISEVKTGLNYILDFDAAYINGTEQVSYAMDADGDTTTTEDINVFTYLNGTVTGFDKGENLVAYTNVFYGNLNGTETLFVSDMKNIYYVKDGEVVSVFETYANLSGNINFVSGEETNLLLWTQTTETGNEVYSSAYKDNAWTIPIKISDTDLFLTEITADIYNDKLMGTCTSTVVEYNEETGICSDGATNLCSFVVNEMQDISVDSIIIDERDIVIGQETEFTVHINNNGSETVNSVTFVVSDGLGYTQTVTQEVNVPSGEYVPVTLTYTAPENYTKTTLSISASSDHITDEQTDNNTTTTEIGVPQIIISESEIHEIGDEYIVTAILTNESDVDAENIVVKSILDDENNEAFTTFTVESILARESKTVEFVVAKTELTLTENNAGKMYLSTENEGVKGNKFGVVISPNENVCAHPLTTTDRIEPTCISVGYEKNICSACGETVIERVLEKVEHCIIDNVCSYCGFRCGTCGEDAYWYFWDGELVISGSGAVDNFISVTPSLIDLLSENFELDRQIPWSEFADEISSVVVEEGIIRIGSGAFYGVYAYDGIYLPETLTEIGDLAFGKVYCEDLSIPDNVTVIGDFAFYMSQIGMLSLGSDAALGENSMVMSMIGYIDISEDNPNLSVANGTYIYNKDGTTLIYRSPFSEEETIEIPNAVTEIGNGALFYAISENPIIVPSSVKIIGDVAFFSAEVPEIILPEGLKTIGDFSFVGASISELVIPASVEKIGALLTDCFIIIDEANENYCSIESVVLSKDMESLVYYPIFYPSDIQEIPEGINIKKLDPYSCMLFTDIVYVPKTVEEIAENAFWGSEFEIIVVPDSVTYVSENAFNNTNDFKAACSRNSYFYEFASENGIAVIEIGYQVVHYPEKREYVLGEELSVGGMKIVFYDGTTFNDVTDNFVASGYNRSKAGTQTITLSFDGKEFSYDIYVSEYVYSSDHPYDDDVWEYDYSWEYIVSDNIDYVEIEFSDKSSIADGDEIIIESLQEVYDEEYDGYYYEPISEMVVESFDEQRTFAIPADCDCISVRLRTNGDGGNDYGFDIVGAKGKMYSLDVYPLTYGRVEVGDTVTLEAKLLNNIISTESVGWHSSNNHLAVVDETGKVTFKGFGKVTITATGADGRTGNYTFNVKSSNPSIEIYNYGRSNNVKIDWWKPYSSATMQLGFKSFNCEGVAYYTWKSDNRRVKVDKGLITNTGYFSRSANITVTAYDFEGNVVTKSSVRVSFYKFNWQKDKLKTQAVLSGDFNLKDLSVDELESQENAMLYDIFYKIFNYMKNIFKNIVSLF